MTYIVGFNGPPHCGKDTIGNALARAVNEMHDIEVEREALSLPMREIGFAMLNRRYHPADPDYDAIKDHKQTMFNRCDTGPTTLRQFMINFSELFCKTVYGHDIWAKHLFERNALLHDGAPGLVIVSDVGFQVESAYFNQYAESYLLVQLSREGCDWSKDSRGYVTAPNMVNIENDGTVDEVVGSVYSAMLRLGWVL